jgi:Short C-terminal domain
MPGLLRGVARTAVVAGTASAVGGRVRHRQDRKWAQQDAQAEEPQQVPEQRSAPPAPDRLQQLKELGELKAQGVLDDDEFAAEKAKILAG